MPRMDTPELVRAIRTRTGESQEDLARRIGVSFATVNAWENGRSSPRATHRFRLDEMAREAGVRQGFQVLIVDDDESAAALARALVETIREDAEVTVANNGSEGLLRCGDLKPDLVLLDIMMPGIDGLGVAEKLNLIEGLEHTVIVFVTSVTDTNILARARNSQALAVLPKPLTRDHLVEIVERLGASPVA